MWFAFRTKVNRVDNTRLVYAIYPSKRSSHERLEYRANVENPATGT